MVNYPNEKKARNQELLKDTLDGMSMLDRIIKYRVSSVRIGLIVRRETVKIMKNTLTSTSATIASNYDIPEDKIIKLIEKEKLKIALPKPTII